MNPVVLQFANGNVFFIGLAMVTMTLALLLRQNGRLLRSLFTIIGSVGIVLVILSATPLPMWMYAPWVGICIAGLFLGNARFSSVPVVQSSWVFCGAVAVASLVLATVELPYHLSPVISVSRGREVFVIGDSISAGIKDRERTWPDILSDLVKVKVTNLARAGATTESAMAQASKIPPQACVIIVEIGGNDLISGTDSREFDRRLDTLLSKICVHDNQVIMLELPLFPLRIGFGRSQRALAKQYGVRLLPKKLLTNVFALENATSDGLHFSQIGHDALAKEIQAALLIKPK